MSESPKETTNETAADGQHEALPPPPFQRVPARGGGRRRDPLTREAIVAAALRVLDREGLAGFSMRRVASSGKVGVTSARFTMVYVWRGGKWLIVDRHSSLATR